MTTAYQDRDDRIAAGLEATSDDDSDHPRREEWDELVGMIEQDCLDGDY